jgi:hypothetical protein
MQKCVRLETDEYEDSIPMCQLKAGKIGLVINQIGDNEGNLVMKDNCGHYVIIGSEKEGENRANTYMSSCELRVRVLEPGEKIVIT